MRRGSEEYPHQDMKELLHQFLEVPRGGGQHRIDRSGLPAPQIVLQHPVVIFQMSDQRLYPRPTAERVMLLAAVVDTVLFRRIPLECLDREDYLTLRRTDQTYLVPELVFMRGLPLREARRVRLVKAVHLVLARPPVALALLHARLPRDPVAALYHLLVQTRVRRKRRVVPLHRRVRHHKLLLRQAPEQAHAVLEDLAHPFLPDTLPEVDEVARVARKTVLEERLSAEILHVRVHHPRLRQRLVPVVVKVLQHQATHHQTDRHRRAPTLRVQRGKLPLEVRPVYLLRQQHQLVVHVDEVRQ